MAASVLIVEDERIVAADLQQTLRGMGYDAYAIARSADEALACAAERRPELALVDVRIHGVLDGTATAALLHDRYDVPIVFLTAHSDDATLERAKASRAYGFLLKPVKHAELKCTIELALHRHAAERELRARERWFLTTLTSITDAVVTTDASGCVSFMNATAEALTGVTLGEGRGRPIAEVVRVRTAEGPRVPIAEALATRRPVEIAEAELVGASTVRRIITEGAAPVCDGTELLGAVMTFRDITERRVVQRRLEQSERLASLGTMAATVGHEINNPLTVVAANATYAHEELVGLLDTLRARDAVTPDEVTALTELIGAATETHAAVAQIARIVSDLSAFARPPAQSLHSADVRRVIDWAVRLTSHELRLRATVAIDIGATSPIAAIEENKLRQVLINLLLNAAHAIAPGNVANNRVTITVHARATDVLVEVRDTGTGIPSELAPVIFDHFFTTKPLGVGTGLGLAVCRDIITQAGGSIVVDSEVGKGSTFRLTLPRLIAEPVPASPVAAPVEPPLARRARILVVDDEELLLLAMQRILDGHELVTTTDPGHALELIGAGEEFDVILSDLGMPNMSGTELYDRLATHSPEAARRVVFMTGGVTTPATVAFLESLHNVTLEKPHDLPRLPRIVQRVLAGLEPD